MKFKEEEEFNKKLYSLFEKIECPNSYTKTAQNYLKLFFEAIKFYKPSPKQFSAKVYSIAKVLMFIDDADSSPEKEIQFIETSYLEKAFALLKESGFTKEEIESKYFSVYDPAMKEFYLYEPYTTCDSTINTNEAFRVNILVRGNVSSICITKDVFISKSYCLYYLSGNYNINTVHFWEVMYSLEKYKNMFDDEEAEIELNRFNFSSIPLENLESK